MTNNDGVIARLKLDEAELAAVFALADACTAHDGRPIKLNPGMLRARPGEQTDDFLFYADGRLVGFLGMYGFKPSEIEVSGIVHPEYRRRGVFSALYAAARRSCVERRIPSILWICERHSAAGKAFVQSLGAAYSFSEYAMDLDPAALPPAAPGELDIRPATAADAALIGDLMASGFGMDAADIGVFIDKEMSRPDRNLRVVSRAGQPFAVIGAQTLPEGSYVYGFVVAESERGRGYGRQILLSTVHELVAAGQTAVSLEVLVGNERALGLYTSCGFRETSAIDYYTLPLAG
ncbi:MAG TPA: GNAT family N-acetyltransferase [Herpetosiphonaceae bacterium]|nr:GNAT family N-acetyltransferase [Herpetosiphonaceae bacterium]